MGSNPTLSATSLPGRRQVLRLLAAFPLAAAFAPSARAQLAPELESFIQDMVRKHRFSDETLRGMFAKVEPNQAVVNA
ncbi:MAG TPA: hypothetical protein VLD15_01480, partial [Burkholderiales bacterium]|nr:hypothetical protein [Burkholderiales bacterium]